MFIESLRAKVSRKKVVDLEEEVRLHKCLHTSDLIFMGITALGVSVYVVGGQVVQQAGPAAFVSYILASIAAAFSALCYAEFGTRIPKAGSAYIYTYVCMGELWGFMIGWCILIEYLMGAASVVSSASLHINLMCNNSINAFLQQHLPINSFHFFNKHPDMISFAFTSIATAFLCIGMRTSSTINKLITTFNIICCLSFIAYAAMFINFNNWIIPKDSVPNSEKNGEGGLLPHTISGVIAGAGIAFYSFVGFDIITIEGEESLNPKKSIPIALLIAILFTLIQGSVMTSLLTLIVPYYEVQVQTPFYDIFVNLGETFFSRFVGIFIITTLIAGLYPGFVGAPRIIYAMASDGLLMEFLSRLSRFKTPVFSNLLAGFVVCIFSVFVNLEYLVGLLSLGTLITYTLVCYCVLQLRYQKQIEQNSEDETVNQLKLLENKKEIADTKNYGSYENRESEAENESSEKPKTKRKFSFNDLFYPPTSYPTAQTEKIFKKCIVGIVVVSSITAFVTSYFEKYLFLWDYVAIGLVSKCIVIYLIFIIWSQPSVCPQNSFNVPLMPFIPIIGMIINIYLMIYLPGTKWMGIGAWLLLGFFVYFSYGIRKSHMNIEYQNEQRKDLDKMPQTNKVE